MKIDGEYKIKYSTPIGEQELTFIFLEDGEVLKGTCIDKDNKIEFSNGTIKNNEFNLKLEMVGPLGKIMNEFNGTIDNDLISGKIKNLMGKTPFKGSKLGSNVIEIESNIRKRPAAQVYERILCGGVDFNDFFKLIKRTDEEGEDWVLVCEEMGDRNFNYAKEQLAANHKETARYFFLSAAGLYRIGQYGLNEVTEEKLRLYHKIVDSTRHVAKLSSPEWEEIQIPYKDYMMDGWLLKPKNMKPKNPIVIAISGATGFKEEGLYQISNFVERGLAVLLIDGPGQGTTLYFNKGYLELEVEKAYSKMVDWVEKDGRFGKIGISGGSTGGYYVLRVAATDKRIDACVINGGSYHPEEILNFAPVYKHKFANLFGVEDEEMDELFPLMTLKGLADKIECPLLIMHGESDPIFSVKSVQRIYDEAKSNDKTIRIYPKAWHCCAGFDNEAWKFIADWFVERLA